MFRSKEEKIEMFVNRRASRILESLSIFEKSEAKKILEVAKTRKGKQVVVMDLQTAYNRLEKGFLPKDMFDALVIDEAHYSAKKSVGEEDKIVDKLKNIMSYTPKLNVTATPFDERGRYIDTLGYIDDRFNIAYMVKNGYLSNVNFYIADVYSSNKEVYEKYKEHLVKKNGAYTEKSVAKATNSQAGKILTQIALQHTFSNKSVIRQGERALVYAGSIDQAEWITREFKQRGFNSNVVHSKVKNALDVVKDFNEERFDVLVSVDMLIMGIVIKNVKNSIFYRGISSRVTYQQLTARGCGGDAKYTAIPNKITDYTDTYAKMGHPHDFVPFWGDNEPKREKECKGCGCSLKEFPMKSVARAEKDGFVFHKKECIICGFSEFSERTTNEDDLLIDSFNIIPAERKRKLDQEVKIKKWHKLHMSQIAEISKVLKSRDIDPSVICNHLAKHYESKSINDANMKYFNKYYKNCLNIASSSSLDFIKRWENKIRRDK